MNFYGLVAGVWFASACAIGWVASLLCIDCLVCDVDFSMGGGSWCFVFFFQAEDGIRDVAVTGVQTCALPISDRGQGESKSSCLCCHTVVPYTLARPALRKATGGEANEWETKLLAQTKMRVEGWEIGRASCRERV